MKHTAWTHALALALGATSLLAVSLGSASDADAAEWLRPTTAPSLRPAAEVASRFVEAEGSSALRLEGAILAPVRTLKLGQGSVVRFEQRYRGVVVEGRSVALRIAADGRVRTAMVDVARGLDVDVTPAIHVDLALESAAVQLPFAIGPAVRSELVVVATSQPAHLAWRIDVRDARGGGRLLVDAHDGALLGYRTLASTARGLVYEQNSVTTPDPIEVELTTLDTAADPLRLTGWDGLLHVTNYVSGGQSGYEVEQTVGPSEGEDFLYDPPVIATSPNDEFAQVGLFYHLTEHRDFFRDDLGVDVDGEKFKITAVANARENGAPLDNAFYSPTGLESDDPAFDAPNLIAIGQGTQVDFASDSDVFKHEFGHYISGTVVGYNLGQLGSTEYGFSPHSGSVDEGIADYFACTESGDPLLGEATLEPLGAERHLDDDSRVCPTDMVGEVHEDGELIGSLGWTLRETFGREVADPLVWGAVSLMPIGGTLGDFASGVVETAGGLVDDGVLDEADVATIQEIIAARGLDECGSVIPLHGSEPRTTTMIGLDQAGQALSASCSDLRSFNVEVQSIFHFEADAPEDATSATFHIDMTPLGGNDLKYRVLVRRTFPVSFGPGAFLPVPSGQDYEVASEGQSVDIHIDASSDPPFTPGAHYFAVIMSQNCPAAQLDISFLSEGPSGEGGGGGAGGGEATSTTSTSTEVTAGGSTTAAVAGAGGGTEEEAAPQDDGCDCRTTPGTPTGPAGALALALGALAVASRRRRG